MKFKGYSLENESGISFDISNKFPNKFEFEDAIEDSKTEQELLTNLQKTHNYLKQITIDRTTDDYIRFKCVANMCDNVYYLTIRKTKEENQKIFYYEFVDDREYDDIPPTILCTDKNAKELIEKALDIWDSCNMFDELDEEYNYNEDDGTITINGKEYDLPNCEENFINFVFEILDGNGIKNWLYRPPHINETFYY